MPINAKEVVSKIPLAKIFRLISHLLKSIKGGIDEEERAVLLQDLMEIGIAIADEVAQ
jgi:hypothetical protein